MHHHGYEIPLELGEAWRSNEESSLVGTYALRDVMICNNHGYVHLLKTYFVAMEWMHFLPNHGKLGYCMSNFRGFLEFQCKVSSCTGSFGTFFATAGSGAVGKDDVFS